MQSFPANLMKQYVWEHRLVSYLAQEMETQESNMAPLQSVLDSRSFVIYDVTFYFKESRLIYHMQF
jgi:hypothetical protein